ncbi:MAG: tRNA 2-thiocytidine(32) synthetase TtcA [Gammaproteobacteria bacterium]|nr:tRNA 2-thiocytidine(32) synthetase TtcA [Gammaproteobacteria bacterium]
MNLQRSAPVNFELVAVNLDQKQPGFPEHVLPAWLEQLGIEYHIVEKDTYSIVQELTPEGATFCAVCSRLRRGTLYGFARRIGADRIALGHHMDDIVETLFLNLFHGSTLKTMPPKLLSDDGRNLVIRPLAYCREADIARWAEHRAFPIIPCDLCGSQDNLERQVIKRMLAEWSAPIRAGWRRSAGRSATWCPRTRPDTELFDFAGLDAERVRLAEGHAAALHRRGGGLKPSSGFRPSVAEAVGPFRCRALTHLPGSAPKGPDGRRRYLVRAPRPSAGPAAPHPRA